MAASNQSPSNGGQSEASQVMFGDSTDIGRRVDVDALIKRSVALSLGAGSSNEALDDDPTDTSPEDGITEEGNPPSLQEVLEHTLNDSPAPNTPSPGPLKAEEGGEGGNSGGKRKNKKRPNSNRRSNEHRAKRKKTFSSDHPFEFLAHEAEKRKKFRKMEHATHTRLNALSLPHASSAFVGLALGSGGRVWRKGALVGVAGFAYKAWGGIVSEPICDASERVVAVLAGRPTSGGYLECTEKLATLLSEAGLQARIPPEEEEHRRGAFRVLAAGVSFGGGQKHPKNLGNNATNTKILERLIPDPNMRRVAGFGSAAFALWAPKLFKYYAKTLAVLYASDSRLQHPHPNSIFTATSLNCGPKTATFGHVDSGNLPFGWCSITALGNFDSTKGGHIVLWDARLVIEFPAGSTILIPSGSMWHSNTAIGDTETRFSITQYCAGSLFRWVEYGCRTATELAQEDPVKMAELDSEQAERWSAGIELFSTLSELMQGPEDLRNAVEVE